MSPFSLLIILACVAIIQSTFQYHPLKNPQERQFHWIKHLKKQQKLKFRRFKKHFRGCGFPAPYKFEIFRRSDDGDVDTVHILVPYGYADEYFPGDVNDTALYGEKYGDSNAGLGEKLGNSGRFRLFGNRDVASDHVGVPYGSPHIYFGGDFNDTSRAAPLYSVRYRDFNGASGEKPANFSRSGLE